MHNFWAQATHLPACIIQKIERLIAAFYWGGSQKSKAIRTISWDTICKPLEQGGLGIPRLKDITTSFNWKLLWNLANRSESLWVKWAHHTHLKHHSLWGLSGNKGSYFWKKLLSYRVSLKEAAKVFIGNGESTSFLFAPWLPDGKAIVDLFPELESRGDLVTLHTSTFIRHNGWEFPESPCLPSSLRSMIASTPHHPGREDKLGWKENGELLFSFKQARLAIGGPPSPLAQVYSWIWSGPGPPKFSLCLWQTSHGKLPTADLLLARNIPSQEDCLFCSTHAETMEHLFFSCPFTRDIWRYCLVTSGWHTTCPSLREYMMLFSSSKPKGWRYALKLISGCCIWHLWKARNAWKYGRQRLGPGQIIRQISCDMKLLVQDLTKWKARSNLVDGFVKAWLAP